MGNSSVVDDNTDNDNDNDDNDNDNDVTDNKMYSINKIRFPNVVKDSVGESMDKIVNFVGKTLNTIEFLNPEK